jgi:NTP pyrophosphatase (non-canonical NTP hydrolase)
MKENFHELYDSLKKDRKISEFSGKHNLETRFKRLKDEVNELGDAISRGNAEDIKDEMGDVFWDIVACSVIAEDKGLFTLKDVLESSNAKLKRRKPWVFEGKRITLEEENKLYKEIKAKEKGSAK